VATTAHALGNLLNQLTIEGTLYEKLPDNAVRCYACAHRCLIRDGREGICRVRFNRDGVLYVPHGYVAALQVDPTEKKPFFHILPGSSTLTFGMLGCDLHCGYCQNWLTSQALRDEEAGVTPQTITPEQMVAIGKRYGAQLFGSSYNEPLITAEWAVEVFKAATQAGFRCVYISNGNATPEVLNFLQPYLTGYKIDLKSMNDKHYRQLGTTLNHVLDGIQMVKERGLWTEIVTLVVPGFNDSNEELWDTARFIASVSPDIPWHVTAFHKDYKMLDSDDTTAADLIRAAEIGLEAGLHYVYAGNLPGRTRSYENTYCPHCGELLIDRVGYQIRLNKLAGRGSCPKCNTPIPGIWK
jgi:pyruvate formate lyase activating enzyme